MKDQIKNYFSITKKEWNGMVVMVILIALVLVSPYIYQLFRKDNTINFNDFNKAVTQLGKVQQQKDYIGYKPWSDKKVSHPVMFPFNPNELSTAQWEQLGLSEHQANIIVNYQVKGGRFYHKEDIKKIYAVTDSDYKKLEPFIIIPHPDYVIKKAKDGELIELNGADSAKLVQIKGIGPAFAMRVLRYRERLGGFYRREQLKEIYGVDSLKFLEIKDEVSLNPDKVKKLSINTISFNQLRLFPYLGFKQANAVIEYRVQHGSYTSMADMKNIVLLDDVILRKIEPYIKFK